MVLQAAEKPTQAGICATVLKGHDFNRAVNAPESMPALAAEG
jgi:hypothetical protein